jgi:hypothetical protein
MLKSKTLYAFGVLALVAVAMGVVLFSSRASAQPVVNWTPVFIQDEIEQGETKTISVSLVSTANVSGGSLVVVPTIAPYVTPSSTTVTLTKNVSKQMTLSLAAPLSAAPGTYDGTLQVRAGKNILSKPLPIRLTIKEQTLIGKDSNADGVWDDVEAAIIGRYPLDQEMQQVQRFGAIALQGAIIAGDSQDLESAKNSANSVAVWAECLLDIQSRDGLKIDFAQKEMSALSSYVITHDSRIAANREFRHLLTQITVPILGGTVEACLE